MTPKFSGWSRILVAVAGIGLASPAFADWTREEIAAARVAAGAARARPEPRGAEVPRCTCTSACAHAAKR